MTTIKSMEIINNLPPNVTILTNQVAGHTFQDGKNTIGILKQEDGKILKPATKEQEIEFYESVKSSNDPILKELQLLIPTYYGIRTLNINQNDIKFMILENITRCMREPSIIDIKIGKITWDPNASIEKIESEKKKYQSTKNEIGLCLPGFEYFDIKTSKLFRFGKDYGKKLNTKTFINSIKLFLNGAELLNIHLLAQIIGQLWYILYWWRKQRKLAIYSSSLLIAYDTFKLKKCQRYHLEIKHHNSLLINSINLKRRALYFLDQIKRNTTYNGERYWHRNLEKLNLLGDNSLNKELQILKDEYFIYLEENGVKSIDINHQWVRVKMIDFAHVFPSHDNSRDENYLEGLENLCKIFETLLLEASCNLITM